MLLRLEGLEGGVCQVEIVEGGGVAGIFVGYGEEAGGQGLVSLDGDAVAYDREPLKSRPSVGQLLGNLTLFPGEVVSEIPRMLFIGR